MLSDSLGLPIGMLLPRRYCSQAEYEDMLLSCLPQRDDEVFSRTASFRGRRLLHFFSGSLGSDATNERLELRGFSSSPKFQLGALSV